MEQMDACCSCVVLGIHVHPPTCLDLPSAVVVAVITVLPVACGSSKHHKCIDIFCVNPLRTPMKWSLKVLIDLMHKFLW